MGADELLLCIDHGSCLDAFGSDNRAVVIHSVYVKPTDDIMQPVNEFIKEHRMVLVDRFTMKSKAITYGRAVVWLYGSPSFRHYAMTDKNIEDLRGELVAYVESLSNHEVPSNAGS